MFKKIPYASGDPILGLIETYNKDCNTQKVDLGVGVYRDHNGHTPILESVKKAEANILKNEKSKAYVGSHGDPVFAESILGLVLGNHSKVLLANRSSVSQTPGGSGALKLAADFIRAHLPEASIWLPTPTWSNHFSIFAGAGLTLHEYPYVSDENSLDFDSMLLSLKNIPHGDIVLLHACCHNPTGFDLSIEQWGLVRDVILEKGLLPLIDFAYQGFGEGLEPDAYGVRLLADALDELLITSSYSKNFGLYRERTGALIAIASSHNKMQNIRTQLAITARHNYSSPPNHGSAIVAEVLGSQELSALWRHELDGMRARIVQMRHDFVEAMKPYKLNDRFSCVNEQQGMFSYTGLSAEQVLRLREEFSIYMVGSGRANMSGLTKENLSYVAKSVASVI
ncbi:aromatic amino acid transaminase [Halomonas campaniensis]|uniref:Aromatic amino acid aminotransferase n=1 Tax=Halomonas campaniensis TaxID=213554 RepID=A0A246S3Z1_9GAMM|nr:amino acid aminotransferase [Halomonas campaniensis]OWV31181.1 aromatic amino acid aminotransferase [Halomonas campaniensis]